MTRVRAFLVHLSLSAVIVGGVFAIVFFAWYPQPYFEVVGAWYLIRILFFVDVVLGPLLTLIIFKPGKPGLRFDLTVIALVQIAALGYGTTTTYLERPYYLLFVVDRFEFAARKDVDDSKIKYDALRQKPWFDAVMVYAKMPEDPLARSEFTEEVLFEGKPDLNRRPEFWHPYADYAGNVPAQAKPVEALLKEDESASKRVSKIIEKFQPDHAKLGYVPLLGRDSDFSVVLDMETGEQLAIIDVDPYRLIIDGQSRPEP